LSYGLKPLAVCATICDLSKIGRENLNNIANLVDLVEVTPQRKPRLKINRFALETVGDISWPEHQLIFTVPFNVAMEKNISLVLWGENPQNEYGAGNTDRIYDNSLRPEWLSEFGGLNGLRVGDLMDKEIITASEAAPYRILDPDHGVKSLYLGYYFPWDGCSNAIEATKHGFRENLKPVEGIGYHYENLDNLQTGVHDYFKYIKYGFGRCTDLVSNHIRRKRITRREAVEMVSMFDGAYPSSYLGVSLETTLDKLNLGIDQFLVICDKFTNKKLFDLPARGSKRLKPIPKFQVGVNA